MSYCSWLAWAPTWTSVSSGLPRLIALVRSITLAMKASYIDSWISARDGQVHTSPWLRKASTSPSTALSMNSGSAFMMSAK